MQNDGDSSTTLGMTGKDSGVRYKISYTTENEPVVVIENDILDGVDKSDWVRTAKETIKKFRPAIPISGRFVKVNKVTGAEYTNSKYTDHIRKTDEAKYRDKLTAAGNLDEIVIASTKYVNEGLNHSRKDNFSDFARGNVLLQVGDRKYSAEVIIGMKPNGDTVLYDIVNINDKNFDVKKKMNPNPDTSENRVTRREDSPSTDRVPQNDSSVNSHSMRDGEIYSQGKKVTISESDRVVKNIVLNEESRVFRSKNPKGYKVIETMAQDLGMKVKLVKGLMGGDGKKLDGIITSQGIFIDAESKNPTRWVATHEFTHRMKQTAGKTFQKYKDYVIKQMKKAGKYDTVFEEKAKIYDTRDVDYINEEIAADYISTLFSDVNELADFIRESRREAVTIRDIWYGVLDRLGLRGEKKKAQQLWSDAYRKAVLNKDMKYEGEKNLYAGKSAETADNSIWRKAVKMQEDGASKEDILKETGWFVGRDGKWRFEINDRDAKFDKEGVFDENREGLFPPGIGVLLEILQHEKLYEAYPDLQYTIVALSENMEPGFNGGLADNIILLNTNREDRLIKSTLIHEVQHLIQHIEGFSEGSLGETIKKKDAQGMLIKDLKNRRDEVLQSLNKEDRKLYDEYCRLGETLRTYPIITDMNRGIREYLQKRDAFEKLGKILDKKDWAAKIKKYNLWIANPDLYYEELYYNVAGEVEARDAASRINMTNRERKRNFPYLGDENTMLVEEIYGKSAGNNFLADKEVSDLNNSSESGTISVKKNNKWRPDLTKTELVELNRIIGRDVHTSTNNITDTANWKMTRINGKSVFAIYSTENVDNPTLLYESQKGQAILEQNILLDLLEEFENGKNINRKSDIINAILGSDRLFEKRGLGDSDGALARGSGNRDVTVLQGESSPKPTAAFRNVIKNLLEIQGRDRVGTEVKKSISGAHIEEILSRENAEAENSSSDTEGKFIPPGAEPRRDVKVPESVKKGTKVRQFARTAAEAETLTDETAEGVLEDVEKGKFNYTPISNKSAMKNAYASLDTMGIEWVEKKVSGAISTHSLDKSTVAMAEVLMQKYSEEGQNEKAQRLIIDFAAESTRTAQSLQAISMLKKLDPNYEVAYIDKIVENLREEIIERNNKKFGKKHSTDIEVSEELKTRLTEAKTEEEREAIRDEIYTEIADQLPNTWINKWNAWRYMAMLGNARTHVRNVVGNAFFMPMIATKNTAAKFMESIVAKVVNGRGRTGASHNPSTTNGGPPPFAQGRLERITVDMDEDARYEVLRDKKISPVLARTNNSADIDFEYLEKNIKSVVEKPLISKLRSLGCLTTYKTNVADVNFELTGRGVGKSLHSQTKDYGGSFADFTKVMLNLKELLENSLLVEAHSDKAKGTARENPQLKQTYVLFSALQEKKHIIPVQFEIKEYVDENNRLYLAVALTKIETSVMGNTILDGNQASTYLLPISNISISEIFAKINPADKNFLKYIPNQFLNDEQIKAKNVALEIEKKKYSRTTQSTELTENGRAQSPSPTRQGRLGKSESRGGFERSKTFFVGKKYRQFATEDVEVMRKELQGGGKHNPSDIIRDKQRVFDTKTKAVLKRERLIL